MSAERERATRVRDAFEALVDLPPEAREGALRELAEDDAPLAREVSELLEADAGDRDIGALIGSVARSYQERGLSSGSVLGRYRLVEEVGRGGTGTVWLAVRADDAYDAEVAIKVLRGSTDPTLRSRFKAERQILASLDHPNIARLLDGGTAPDGSPYVVMEHVRGDPIDLYCSQLGLSIERRIELFGQLCSAVQYAHRNLVVHRDIKPGNILVGHDGVPKLLDFGIAKLLDAGGRPTTVVETRPGSQLLTPHFASPEQIRGESISTASDVYSLGVLLHHLLTGELPYRLSSTDPFELARAVCELEPVLPSTTARSAPGVPLGTAARARLARRLEGDLDTIVAKALRKEPKDRYGSPEELADDLRRHLERRPVVARPPTLRYHAGRFLSRHRWGVAGSAAAVLAVFGATAFSIAQMQIALEASEVAEELAVQQALRATYSAVEGRVDDLDPATARELLMAVDPADRGWEWRYLHGRVQDGLVGVIATDAIAAGFRSDVDAVLALSPIGRVTSHSVLREESADLGRLAVVGEIRHADISGDGRHIAVAHGEEGSRIALWEVGDAHGPRLLFDDDMRSPVTGLALSDTGHDLVATGLEESWLWREGRTGPARIPEGTRSPGAAISADGGTAVWVNPDDGNSFRVVDTDRPELGAARQGKAAVGVAVSPDGRVLVGGDRDRVVRAIEVGSFRGVARLPGHVGVPDVLAYGPDGTVIASAFGRELRVWRLTDQSVVYAFAAPSPVTELTFSSDGELIASVSEDGRVVLWRARPRPIPPLQGRRVHVVPGGRSLWSSTTDGELAAIDAGSGELFDLLDMQVIRVGALSVSADGRWLGVVSGGGVTVRPVERPSTSVPLDVGSTATAIAFSPSTPHLATLDATGETILWNVGAWTEQLRLPGPPADVGAVTFSPDGSQLVTVHAEAVRVWDLGRRNLVHVVEGEGRVPLSVAYRPDGGELAMGWSDGAITLWSQAGSTGGGRVERHRAAVTALAYSPDGSRLASGDFSGSARVAAAASTGALLELEGHDAAISSMTFTEDGAKLVTADIADRLRVWDAAPSGATGLESERLRVARRATERLVDSLLRVAPDPDVVARTLRGDPGLDTIHRRAALQRLTQPSLPEPGIDGDPFDGFSLAATRDDSYMLVEEADELRMTESFTVELWVQPLVDAEFDGILVAKEEDYLLNLEPTGEIRWIVMGPTDWAYPWRGTRHRLEPGRWTHVALVREAGSVRLHLNGRLVQVRLVPPVRDRSAFLDDFRIAGRASGSLSPRALVDEVRVWGVARSEQEIRDGMLARMRGDEPGLISSWSFAEGGGNVARDATGRHDGTVVRLEWRGTSRER